VTVLSNSSIYSLQPPRCIRFEFVFADEVSLVDCNRFDTNSIRASRESDKGNGS
jgi:hypothetical protein